MLNIIIATVVLIIAYFSKLVFVGSSENATFVGGDYKSTQRKVLHKYRKYRKPRKKVPFNEFCFPKTYKVQPQQALIGDFMDPKNNRQGYSLLVFHRIGAGKTCLSIQVAEKWLSKGKPLMLMPASLIPGFRNELRGMCGGYLTPSELKELKQLTPGSPEYRKIIIESDRQIDLKYNIMSYNKFLKEYTKIKAPIIIIDEVQNVSGDGSFGKAVQTWINKHPAAAVILMSGTPIFDNVSELNNLSKLLRINGVIEKPDDILKLYDGKVSFFNGAPDYTFPDVNITVKKCPMSKFQAKWYKSEVEAEMSRQHNIKLVPSANDFYIKTRQRSNIVYPNGLTGEAGLSALTKALIKSNLEVYSTKFFRLVKKLRKNQLSFIYSGFTGVGGIACLCKILRAYGWSDFLKSGPGKRRYAIWSGEETGREKDMIKETFNSDLNDDASQIQIIIGSPSIKEGVSLLRVRQAHIIDGGWSPGLQEQIYGRIRRYCAHKSLPKSERTADIYLYAAVMPKDSVVKQNLQLSPDYSIDLYMLDICEQKKEAAEPYLSALQEVSIDKLLH